MLIFRLMIKNTIIIYESEIQNILTFLKNQINLMKSLINLK